MLNINNKFLIEEKIKDHDRFTYDILDGMIDWVRVIDKNGVVIYTNEPMRKGLGRNIVGESCYSILGKSCPCKRCITQTTISTGIVSEKEEVIGDRVFSVKTSPVKDEKGKIYAVVEVFRDVTRERKLEKEIIKKNEKMSKDLVFARTLQQKILPTKGNFKNVYIDYLYQPSEMLSGDLFDVFIIDDNHIGIYICDVVGHGVTASMLTMFVRQTVRAIKDYILSPSKVLSELHRRFLYIGLDDDKYFTIFYSVLNLTNNKLTYVNGGHNSLPFLKSNNNIEVLESKGYPIASIFDVVEYEEKTKKLEEGDKILFFTDGIIESKNKLGEQFGLNRLIEIVKNNNKDIIKNIENDINNFSYGEQEDDFAALMLQVLK